MSIRYKLIIMFLAIALIPLLFVSVLTFHNYKNSLEATHLSHLQNLAAFKVERIETYFAGLKADMAVAQGFYNIKKNLPVLTRFANEPENPEFLAAKKMLDEQLQQMQSVSGLTDIMLVSPEGKAVYSSNPKHYPKDFLNPLPDLGQKAFEEGKNKVYSSDVFLNKQDSNKPEIVITAPATDFKGDFIGVIGFEVDMTPVNKLMQDATGLGKTGEVLVGKKVGNEVVYLSPLRHEPNTIMKRINIGGEAGGPIQEAVQGGNGAGQLIDYRGKKVIAAWRYIPSLDWGMVAKIDTKEAFADVTNLRNLIAIILAMIIVLSGATAFSIAQSISEPIKRLSEGAEIIGGGRLDYKVGTNLKDEIGQLSRSFDKMTVDLKQTTASRDELSVEVRERKEAEAALRESEMKYRTVADNTYDWEFWIDPEGRFIYCSPSCERITGHKPEKFFADPSLRTSLIHPDDRPLFENHRHEVEDERMVGKGEWRYVRPDGTICWVAHVCQSVFSDKGEYLGVRGSNRDVTKRKRMEDELRKLASVVEHTSEFISLASLDGKIIFLNEAGANMLGLSAEEVGQMPLLQVITEHFKDKVQNEVLPTLKKKGRWEGELQYQNLKTGRLTDVYATTFAINDPDTGAPLYLANTSLDITERKRMEDALAGQRKEQQVILESVPAMIFYKDRENHFVRTNKAFEDAMGLPKEKLEGCSLFDIYPKETAEAYWNDDKEVMTTRKAKYRIVEQMQTPRGTRILQTDKVPYLDESGDVIGVIGFAVDITERKQAEEELRTSEERLRQALDAAELAPWESDLITGEVISSPRMAKIYGVDEAQLPRTRGEWQAFILEEDRALLEPAVDAAAGGDGRYRAEFRIRRPDGAVRWIRSEGQLHKDEDGRPCRLGGLLTDITERKQAEEAVRKSGEDLNRAQAVAHTGSWRMDVQRNELTWSEEAHRIFGIPAGTPMTYEGFLDCVHPEDRKYVNMKWREALRGKDYDIEYRIVAAGNIKWVKAKAELEFEKDGTLLGGFGTVTDITERKEMEEALREAKEGLEIKVEERTAELADTISVLQEEAQERLKAEETVKAERQRFNNVLEMMPAYAVLLTPDYHVAYANHTFREWFGDDNGKRCYEFLFNRKEPCETCETYTVLKTRKPNRWEWRGPNGRDYDIFDYPFSDVDGSPLIMEIGVDVTEHKQAQEQLRSTSLYARGLIEASPDPLVTISADGKITDVNEATIKVTGVSREKLIGTDFSNYFTEPKKAREGYRKVFAEGFVTDYPLTIKHRQGRLTDVLYNAAVYKNEAGEIQGVFAAARDVTVQKQASQYARNLIETSLDPLVTISADGKITDVNEATIKVTGVSREKLIGTDFLNYFTEPEKAREGYQEVFAKGFVTDYPLTIRHKKGQLTDVLYNAAIYKDTHGNVVGVFAAARDITEKKAAEAELEKYRQHLEDEVKQRTEELARSNRDLEQFAYVASHDLQEPLRAVAGFVGLLRMQLRESLDAKKLEYMNFATDGVARMQGLISGLLEYSRVGTREKEPEMTDSKAAIGRAIAHLGGGVREFGAKITIADDMPKVCVDSTQLAQLFQNLVGNAIKFCDKEAPQVHISAVREDSAWRFAVADNGIGIEPQYAERIFQIFQRLHSRDKYPGTGIGLAICKKIVERHGGKIWVESKPGSGSTFYFTIPDKGDI